MLYKASVYIRIKRNKELNKVAKQEIDILGMTTTRLPYTDYYYYQIEKWESVHNICRQHEVKLSRHLIGLTRLIHEHLMTSNDQQPTCTNATCRNQTLTIKHCLEECPK